MHPRSPYHASPPDFAKLAQQDPALRKHVVGNTVDFKDPQAARAVTKALLLHDFDIKLELSLDRLCPPVPNRLNYVLWLEDLVSETRPPEDSSRPVIGIDIGTGSTAIYPLLTCRRNPSWIMYGLECDVESLSLARTNVAMNDFSERIRVRKSDSEKPILLQQHDIFAEKITFTMCNPPFYASPEEMRVSRDLKTIDANSSNTGSRSELITTGGEVSFTASQIRDSLVLRDGVQWYSTMLGKKDSLAHVVDMLRHDRITNYAITELVQGQTRRWAVAWSFSRYRPLARSSRCPTSVALDLGPSNPLFCIPLPDSFASKSVDVVVEDFLERVGVQWEWITVKQSRMICVVENTWSRQARRKLDKIRLLGSVSTSTEDDAREVAMRVQLNHRRDEGQIELLWRYGLDNLLFESFCGKMKQLLR